jgi:TatD DNase family protein
MAHEHHQHQVDVMSIATKDGYLRWLTSMHSLVVYVAATIGCNMLRLPEVFIENGWCPSSQSGTQWNPSMEAMLMDVAKLARRPIGLHRLSCSQPSHFVEVLHWKCLAGFLATHPNKEADLKSMPLAKEAVDHIMTDIGLPQAVDSHCHLATYVAATGRSVQQALENALGEALEESEAELNTPNIILAIDNRVFHSEWKLPTGRGVHPVHQPPHNVQLRVENSYGVHPKETTKINWQLLEQWIRGGSCVAIGECGLDHTSSHDHQKSQVRTFRRQVKLANVHQKPLILHLRPAGRNCRPVIVEALDILRTEGLDRQHPIHFHCFTGSYDDYSLWIRGFPNTIFGITTATIGASNSDLARLADLRRIVLESDTPYLRQRGGERKGPYNLRQQAAWVAAARGLPVRAILQATAVNALAFYC